MPGPIYAVPPPDSRELLPPLLACLSTASHSKETPPGLLPLLSPILRQRLQLLASDDWPSLLTWDRDVGAELPHIIQKIQVEPHPSSGEIEVEEPDDILYRRSDAETLHSRLILSEFGLIPTYLWCTGGEGGDKWSLAELRGIQHAEDSTEWFTSMSEANETGYRRKSTFKANTSLILPTIMPPESESTPAIAEEEDDDDSYWAAYDRTPGRTPQQKRSPAPMTSARTQIGPTQSELDYFARYASEVQPALDAHDANEELPAAGESTLTGNTLDYSRGPQTGPLQTSNFGSNGYDSSSLAPAYLYNSATGGGDNSPRRKETRHEDACAALNHPRPSSSASSSSVERLERKAENYSQTEIAIKQHISTDIKSLFRLAKASGMERLEFERIIHRELEILPLLEQEE